MALAAAPIGTRRFLFALVLCWSPVTGSSASSPGVPPELAWLHSELSVHCFVSVHAEAFNATTGLWESGSWRPQPFKTTVDASRQAVYWHKDMMQDFYGELYAAASLTTATIARCTV